jgi:hypothetical protein
MSFILVGPITFYFTNAIYQHFVIKRELPLFKVDNTKRHVIRFFNGNVHSCNGKHYCSQLG